MGLVVTGWRNVRPDLRGLDGYSIVLAKSDLKGDHPALSTLPRAAELLGDSLRVVDDVKPKLVISDYWSIEGSLAARMRRIPCMISIPSVIGPFNSPDVLRRKLANEENVRALEYMEQEHGITVDLGEAEMIFDSIHFPSPKGNLVYTYEGIPPPNYLDNRLPAPYYLIGGPIRTENSTRNEHLRGFPTIIISFGRKAMGSFERHIEDRVKIQEFMGRLTALLNGNYPKVIFDSKGTQVLREYPENWEVQEMIGLEGQSPNPVLITDGDYTTFHDALKREIPMVVIPFTDRNQLIGERVEALGVGVNIGKGWNLDRRVNADNLSASLADEVSLAVEAILSDPRYRQAYEGIELTSTSLYALLKSTLNNENLSVEKPGPRLIQGQEYANSPMVFSLKRGQIVCGTDDARVRFEEVAKLPQLHIWQGEPFSELASKQDELPVTLDKYLDALRYYEIEQIDLNSDMPAYTRLLQALKIFLNGETDTCWMSVKGIDFFAELFGVRFLVDHFDPNSNYITAREMAHILNRKEQFQGNTIFYQESSEGWQEVSFEEVEQFISNEDVVELNVIENVIEYSDGDPIPWEQGVYINTSSPETAEALKEVLVENKVDLSLVQGVIPICEENSEDIGMEEAVLVSAQNLLKLKEQFKDSQTFYGLLVSAAKGVFGQNSGKNVVIVMLMDVKGRTAIGKCDGIQFPNADESELFRNAFSRAMRQIE